MIPFARGLKLPLDAVTQTFGMYGRKGSGKTYAAGVLVEGLVDVGAQVVVLDPIGNWYGLRLGRDGKGAGLSIPLFGGEHGDIPLEPGAGELVADVIVDRGCSVVLDVSGFRKGQRKTFVAAFAEALFHRKKRARTPLHIVLEEAQLFAPQRSAGDDARMLGAMEDIVRLGRNYGIGSTMVSQRPQSVNTEVRTQAECLVLLQLPGAHERKAIQDWIVAKGVDVRDMVDDLPGLEVGEALIWSPQWLRHLGRARIRRKRTFDASATPELGQAETAPRALAPMDLEAIRGAMVTVVERAAAEDPKKLRARIAELERELKASPREPERVVEVERVEVPVVDEETRAALVHDGNKLQAIERVLTEVGEAWNRIAAKLKQVDQLPAQAPAPLVSRGDGLYRDGKREATLVGTLPKTAAGRIRVAAEASKANGSAPRLKKGAREMLRALAALHPRRLTRHQVATLAGMSPTSGTFSTYLGHLRQGGYMDEDGTEFGVTTAGLAYLGGDVPSAPRSTDELVGLFRRRLKAGARRMLDVLVKAYPQALTREELGNGAGIASTSGTFSTYLGHLRRNGLVDVARGGGYAASPTLFLGGVS